MLNILKKICLLSSALCFLYAANSLRMDLIERAVLAEVAKQAAQVVPPHSSLHTRVSRIRDYLLTHYILTPKSDEQRHAWMATRTFLRQSALSTIQGSPALCGELARLAIKVLKAEGIDARRIYFYKNKATSHVLFEYYDRQSDAWRMMDSYASTPYLTSLLNDQALTVEQLFHAADPGKLVYDKYGYLPSGLFFYMSQGIAMAVPYKVSWFYEEVYAIKFVAGLIMGGTFMGLWLWCRRLSNRGGRDPLAALVSQHVV